jgi:hypothetical protein
LYHIEDSFVYLDGIFAQVFVSGCVDGVGAGDCAGDCGRDHCFNWIDLEKELYIRKKEVDILEG